MVLIDFLNKTIPKTIPGGAKKARGGKKFVRDPREIFPTTG